ncbi:DUF2334 domain-containing protein [Clostridium vincentii]|uniref:Copper amine oxidase-like N-terminal domain-containing protein n=1 Tax=Clostridium vincentii TaxID=52704 RepID=A0A2T0BG95_9CLOT|nr:DUF2334 domain-containing protein [Clostridium vincentii]PRR82915.1 hypothetical protein CLVI_13580 [Clostridium vincentii]
MKKNALILTLLFVFLLSLISCGKSEEDSLTVSNPPKNDYSTLTDLEMPKDDITIKINGQALNLTTPIYLEKNRYYLCLTELTELLKGTMEEVDNSLNVSLLDKSFKIDLSNNITTVDNTNYQLKKNLISHDGFYYIGFSDLAEILNIYSHWDIDTKTILCKTDGDNIENVTPYVAKIDQVGYLRLEDVALTTLPGDSACMEKLRVIANYLSKSNVPFHIAWISRYIGLNGTLDVDPLLRNDFTIAELVYTLDYFNQHNGSIGLHGYTHQSGNQNSGDGTEFGSSQPSTTRFRERVEKAIETAKYLDIPIDFFETPHYAITPEQNKIAEEYFKILYSPFEDKGQSGIDLTKPQLSPYNQSTYYISTPLDYIPFNNVESSISKLKNANTKNMGSLFFHPRLDFDNISLSVNNDIPEYSYSDNANLKKVISALEYSGFKMSKVNEIK